MHFGKKLKEERNRVYDLVMEMEEFMASPGSEDLTDESVELITEEIEIREGLLEVLDMRLDTEL